MRLGPESPVFSPDLEKGKGFLDFPLIVRGRPLETPRFASPSEPKLRPGQPVSPRIAARQEIDPWERRGVLHRAPRDAGVGEMEYEGGILDLIGCSVSLGWLLFGAGEVRHLFSLR
jgi:hypothetical protein